MPYYTCKETSLNCLAGNIYSPTHMEGPQVLIAHSDILRLYHVAIQPSKEQSNFVCSNQIEYRAKRVKQYQVLSGEDMGLNDKPWVWLIYCQNLYKNSQKHIKKNTSPNTPLLSHNYPSLSIFHRKSTLTKYTAKIHFPVKTSPDDSNFLLS